jgi:hypothetical protein
VTSRKSAVFVGCARDCATHIDAVLANIANAAGDGIRQRSRMAEGRQRQLLWQICEHVSLHSGIRARAGRLFIAPWLINARYPQVSAAQMFPASAFRGMYHLLN